MFCQKGAAGATCSPRREALVDQLDRRAVVRKCHRVRIARRTVLFRLSIALVVLIARRIGAENARNGTTRSHAERHERVFPGYLCAPDARCDLSRG